MFQEKSIVLSRDSAPVIVLLFWLEGGAIRSQRGGNCLVTSLFKFRLGFVGIVQTGSSKPLTQPLSLLITSSDSSNYFQSLFKGRAGEAWKDQQCGDFSKSQGPGLLRPQL